MDLARTWLLKERGWDMAAGQNTADENDSCPAAVLYALPFHMLSA